ncbi:MAG TPA: hypothetical protein VFV10_06940 [Gammaproteobacteria bacterium]|nr:hypothetical protein [Gammaproteobacteria bacterium]
MNCEEAVTLAIGSADGRTAEHRLALEHVAMCPECRDAQRALGALAAERRRRAPQPPPGAVQRAVRAAAAAARQQPAQKSFFSPRLGFWAGMGFGGAIAAGVAAAVVIFASPSHAPTSARATPEISIAANETRDVNISVDAPTALAGAEIHVVLTGGIELAGFDGQKELRWYTDLAAGANQLRLPIVALGGVGGQLLVEVQHGARHRTFVVDVKAKVRQPAA